MPIDVLIVGTSIDSHIDAVLRYLPPGLTVIRFNVDRFPRDHRLVIDGSHPEPQLYLEQRGNKIDISRPGVVWFRRLGQIGISDAVPSKYRQFCIGEAEMALEGVLSLIKPHAWINEYWATRRAANKPYQYAMARSLGFTVPSTLITNSSQAAERWVAANQKAVVKSLHSPVVTRDESEDGRTYAFTRSLSLDDCSQLSAVATTPCQFQTKIDKAYELRVTTIGNHHFTVRIDANGEGKDDWRAGAQECQYRLWTLPDEPAAALNRLMAGLGIDYAASDFIVTPDGQVIFLEANPHGAWLWLEEAVPDLNIAKRIAKHLANMAFDAVGEHNIRDETSAWQDT